MRNAFVIATICLLFAGLGLVSAQSGTSQSVSVPTDKFAAFIIPNPGASLTLTVNADSCKELVDGAVVPADTGDAGLWSPQNVNGPGPYVFTSGLVLSSCEWLRIHGHYKDTCGTGSAGTATNPEFDVDVPGVDIDIDGVVEADEESVGGFVSISTTSLLRVVINPVSPTTRHTGIVKLTAIGVGTYIRLWKDAARTDEIDGLPETYVTPEALPSAIFVEGVAASDMREVVLKVSYTTDGRTTEDKVRLTVVSVELEGLQGSVGNCSTPSTMVDLCGQDTQVQATVSPVAAHPLVSFVFDDANVGSITSRTDIPGTGITILTLHVGAGSNVRHFTFLRGSIGGTTSEDSVQVYGRQTNALKPAIQAGQAYIGSRIVTTLAAEPSRHLFVIRPDGTFWAVTRHLDVGFSCVSQNCGIVTVDAEATGNDFVYLFPYGGNIANLEAAIAAYQCVCYQFCSQNSNTAINTVTGGQLPPNLGWTPGAGVQNNNNPCNCAP